jgi:transcriptional antiterminator RfaH
VRTEALFPGYIFVCLSERDPKFSKLRSTRGVRDFVRFSGKPAVVPEALMARLQQEFGNQKSQRVICRLPQAGQPVMIIDGPFAGLEAIFNTLDGDERAILLLDILGKQQSISVQLSQLDTNYSKS